MVKCKQIPPNIRRMLKQRRTNIVAFELIAAVTAVVCLCPEWVADSDIEHYIDNKPALHMIIKGYSKQDDLCNITGRLWFECGSAMACYVARYVQSKLNLADKPSRNMFAEVESIGAVRVPLKLPNFQGSLGSWLEEPAKAHRLVL